LHKLSLIRPCRGAFLNVRQFASEPRNFDLECFRIVGLDVRRRLVEQCIDLLQIDRPQFGAPFIAARRLAAVVGAGEREMSPLQNPDFRRPNPRIAGRKRRQRGDDFLALLLVGLILDPLLDRARSSG
jgi:hypothetical protein